MNLEKVYGAKVNLGKDQELGITDLEEKKNSERTSLQSSMDCNHCEKDLPVIIFTLKNKVKYI